MGQNFSRKSEAAKCLWQNFCTETKVAKFCSKMCAAAYMQFKYHPTKSKCHNEKLYWFGG